MKCCGVVNGKKLEQDARVKIESRWKCMLIVQAFEQPVPQQLRIDNLEKSQQGPRVKADSQPIIYNA
jgi:hypothetical protein